MVDGTPTEDALSDRLKNIASQYPGIVTKSWREADEAVESFHRELKERLAYVQDQLSITQSPDYQDALVGTLGVDPIQPSTRE